MPLPNQSGATLPAPCWVASTSISKCSPFSLKNSPASRRVLRSHLGPGARCSCKPTTTVRKHRHPLQRPNDLPTSENHCQIDTQSRELSRMAMTELAPERSGTRPHPNVTSHDCRSGSRSRYRGPAPQRGNSVPDTRSEFVDVILLCRN